MKTSTEPELIEKLRVSAKEDQFDAQEMIELLKQLRTISLEKKDPVVTKVVRLAYEHLEKHNSFNLNFQEEETELSDLEYLIELIANPEIKYNREEIKEIAALLASYE